MNEAYIFSEREPEPEDKNHLSSGVNQSLRMRVMLSLSVSWNQRIQAQTRT